MKRCRLVLFALTVVACFPMSLCADEAEKKEPSFRGKTLTELQKELKDKDAEVRRNAALGIGSIGPEAKAATPALVPVLKDSDKNVRVAAATALWRMGSAAKAAAPGLVEALKGDEETQVRMMAAYALGKIGAEKDVVVSLAGVLRSDAVVVRRAAAFALGEIGPPAKEAVSDLVTVFRDNDMIASKNAAQALRKIDPEAAAKAGVK
jgi:vesicle coat complex subunit